jgi:Zn-dependent protease
LTSVSSLLVAQAVIWVALFFLVSGPVHECAHAFTAWRLGDGTAKLFGRVSLDPIVHFDPVGGTLLIASVIFGLIGGNPIGFGWAKPTPVNPYNLHGRHGTTLVSVAGPLSNLFLAGLFAIGFRVLWSQGVYPDNQSGRDMVQLVFFEGVELNVLLMVFNLIPVPPLDGSRVLLDQLDPGTSREVGAFMDQYGLVMLILFVFLAWSIIGPITRPIVSFLIGVPVG